MTKPCRLCRSPDTTLVADFGATPVAHRLLNLPDEPVPTYSFVLSSCLNCGFVQVNEPIEPSILYAGFNFNFSSWKFEPHIDDELALISGQCDLSSVVEIGANDGRFLEMLRARGAGRCIGIEPNPVPGQHARERGLEIVSEMFSRRLAQQLLGDRGKASLVVSRQVMEHIIDVPQFLTAINDMVDVGGMLFLDLPDSAPTFSIGDCTALWEEHVGYYSAGMLHALLPAYGFKVLETRLYDFSGGCIALLARKVSLPTGQPLSTRDNSIAIGAGFEKRIAAYRGRLLGLLAKAREQRMRIVLYGAGVRGCAATSFLALQRFIDLVVDDQVERHGLFLPSTNLPIGPLDNAQRDPGNKLFLLAVNNENDAKVASKIGAALGERALIASLCGPADIHAELDRLQVALTN